MSRTVQEIQKIQKEMLLNIIKNKICLRTFGCNQTHPGEPGIAAFHMKVTCPLIDKYCERNLQTQEHNARLVVETCEAINKLGVTEKTRHVKQLYMYERTPNFIQIAYQEFIRLYGEEELFEALL